MKKIEEVANPQIGKFYLVPCVAASGHGISICKWLPIMGTWHEDEEVIGFSNHHYHYDHRFTSKRQCAKFMLFFTSALTKVHTNNPITNGLKSTDPRNGFHVQYRKLKMQRDMPDWEIGRGNWQPELENQFADKKMFCNVCPHRGHPLIGLPIKDGVVCCPGHGLRWNVKTGKLVKVQPAKILESY